MEEGYEVFVEGEGFCGGDGWHAKNFWMGWMRLECERVKL